MSGCSDGTDLGEDRFGIGNIPMLAELSVPKPEHVDDIVFHLAACVWKAQQTVPGMCPRVGAVNKNEIPLGNHSINCGPGIGNGLEKNFVEFDKSGLPLCGVGIMLDIIVMDKSVYHTEIVPAEHLFI